MGGLGDVAGDGDLAEVLGFGDLPVGHALELGEQESAPHLRAQPGQHTVQLAERFEQDGPVLFADFQRLGLAGQLREPGTLQAVAPIVVDHQSTRDGGQVAPGLAYCLQAIRGVLRGQDADEHILHQVPGKLGAVDPRPQPAEQPAVIVLIEVTHQFPGTRCRHG